MNRANASLVFSLIGWSMGILGTFAYIYALTAVTRNILYILAGSFLAWFLFFICSIISIAIGVIERKRIQGTSSQNGSLGKLTVATLLSGLGLLTSICVFILMVSLCGYLVFLLSIKHPGL